MKQKSKYDIIKDEMKSLRKWAFSFLFKLLSIDNKIKKQRNIESISDKALEIEIYQLFENAVPMVIKAIHISYENAKDIENIDPNKVLMYAIKQKMNPSEFAVKYNLNKANVMKLLLVEALLKVEGIELPKLSDPKIALRLLNGGSIEDEFEGMFSACDNNIKGKISRIFEDDFNISDITETELQFIESYHEEYMEENIYPKVSKESKEEDVLKLAIKFSKNQLKIKR